MTLVRSVRTATLSHLRGLSHWGVLALALVLLTGVVAAGLDAWTTLAMMNSGAFEEANPTAAFGMARVGTGTYVAFATLVSLLYPLLFAVRGPSRVWLALPLLALAFVSYKLYTGVSNVVLWVGVA